MAIEAVPLDRDEIVGIVVAAVLTKGFSLIAEVFRDKEAELKSRNEELRKAWTFFNSEKRNLLPPDRDTAYYALKDARSRLDEAWAEYKGLRKKTMDEHYEAKREKHEAWQNKLKTNIEKNRKRVSNLEGILERRKQNLEKNQKRVGRCEDKLEHKRLHLDDLYEKLADARSDSYRERVEGWIEKESSSIEDLEKELDNVNNWIEEDTSSIQSLEEELVRVNGWIDEDLNKLNN